jgi:hypothetical protein
MTDKPGCASDDPDVPGANSIMVDVCEHGTVTIILLDSDQKPIAQAAMSLEGYVRLDGDVFEQVMENCPDMISGHVVEQWAGETDEVQSEETKH